MDDEIKGIPRRYTEDEWRELTKKKAKSIHPIVKQLALLVSVMVGVALAVSAYTGSSNSIGVSGRVSGTPEFHLFFYDGGQWSESMSITLGDVVKGSIVTKHIVFKWNDDDAGTTSAEMLQYTLSNANNLEVVGIYYTNAGLNAIGHSFGEGIANDLWIKFRVPDDSEIGGNISGDLVLNFDVS